MPQGNFYVFMEEQTQYLSARIVDRIWFGPLAQLAEQLTLNQ